VSTAFESDRAGLSLGGDYAIRDNVFAGLAVAADYSDTDTQFNAGHQDSWTLTLAPYAAWLVTDALSVDATVGYARAYIDQNRTDPVGQSLVTSDTRSDRWFAAINGAYRFDLGRWSLIASGGWLWARDMQRGFSESDGTRVGNQLFKIGQLKAGGEIAYAFDHFEPYVGANLEWDYSSTRSEFAADEPAPDNDPLGAQLMVGIRYFGDDSLSGGLNVSTVLGRDDFSSLTLGATVRYDF
jgi:outer membrane autotransporter protein